MRSRLALLMLVALAGCAAPQRFEAPAPEPVVLAEPASADPPNAQSASAERSLPHHPCDDGEDDGIGGTGCETD